jgi:cobalamin synthase
MEHGHQFIGPAQWLRPCDTAHAQTKSATTSAMKKEKAYIAFVSLFVVFVLILWFGPQLHGWELWLAILASLLFAIWAGATIGGFFGGSGEAEK